MPIYEYRCPNGHVFELFQRMSDPTPDGCEVCGAGPVERVLYPVAIHFKGSGFYATDYGKGSRRSQTASSSSSADGSSDKGGSDKGSKPEPAKTSD
ncbi:MAG: FmdB family zinc ribbon protein [Gaiellaceae bacterium]